MNRREMIKFLVGGLFCSSRILEASVLPGVLLIYDSWSSFDYMRLVNAAGLSIEDNNELVKWDVRSDPDEIRNFVSIYGRGTSNFSWPVLISVPDFFGDDVQVWNLEWLKEHEKKITKGCYPICSSCSWWSVEGDWNPSAKKVRRHLHDSPNHKSGHFQMEWLGLLKLDELHSLHSDHHREIIGEGKVVWKDVNAECPSDHQERLGLFR